MAVDGICSSRGWQKNKKWNQKKKKKQGWRSVKTWWTEKRK